MKRIFPNQDAWRKKDERQLPIVVEEDGELVLRHEIEILGPSRLVFEPASRMIGRFKVFVWIETEAEIDDLHGV